MRRRWLMIGGVLLAVVAAVAGISGWALFRVPAFYEEAAASVQDPVIDALVEGIVESQPILGRI